MVLDLESKLEALAAENTTLTQDKANVEKSLAESRFKHQKQSVAATEQLEARNKVVVEKDSEIAELNKKLDWYRGEVQRLTHHNDALSQTNTSLQATYKQNLVKFSASYNEKNQQLIKLSAEHAELERQFSEMHSGVENIWRQEVRDKDVELERLRTELERAREEVRDLSRRVNSRRSDRYLDIKDMQHFQQSSHRLFVEVQEWCTHFSAFSSGCRIVHVHRITDDEVKERVEQTMLDDRGVRRMLKDETRRPQVFTAILMRLIWEFVFTRYLFGLEVDERQKLLSLERTLAEVGAPTAVHQWRATTLTLLSQRPAFRQKIAMDTETTVTEILRHLAFILPPPPVHEKQAHSTLRALIQHAVTLALEMRSQRAEYVMLRAPRPEYDDTGEVSNAIPFSAARMQNCNHDGSVDADLESEGATLKLVLFPMIIRRGNELGEEYHREVIVSPMQVIVNRPQLRSESRSSMRSVSTAWGGDEIRGGRQAHVGRLTPITDHSPRTTPERVRVDRDVPEMPMIPEATVRLVRELDGDGGTKKRRVGDY